MPLYYTKTENADQIIFSSSNTCCEGSAEYEPLFYNPVVNINYNQFLPNKRISLEGNILVAINNSLDNDSGGLQLIRGSAGDEIINLNGYLLRAYTYPEGAGAIIIFNYINIEGRIYWTCLNPSN